MKRISVILLTVLATVGLDQWTKVLAREQLQHAPPVQVIGDFFRLQYAENHGAFLSLGAAMSEHMRTLVFTVCVLGFLIWASWHLFKNRDMGWIASIAWALLIAGGIGNVIDRVTFGYVTDFMIMGVGPVRTGVFNIADVAIMGGVFTLLFKGGTPKPKPAAEPA